MKGVLFILKKYSVSVRLETRGAGVLFQKGECRNMLMKLQGVSVVFIEIAYSKFDS